MRTFKFILIIMAITMLTGCSRNLSNINQIVANNSSNDMDDKPVSKDKSILFPDVSDADAEPAKKIVVIDPGHANRANLDKEANAPGSRVMKIKDGGGAVGVVTRTPEYVISMEVSVRLRKLLEEKGFKVIMTKTEHSQSLGNIERAKIGNEAKADLVVRVHCDSNNNSSAKGASMLVPQPINSNTKLIYEESRRCGQIVLDTLTIQVGMKSRGLIFSGDITGFNWSEVPVILIEMGFLSNPEEDKLLSSAAYQDRLAKGLADGIEKALK
jgi:N-acetylmuramoyl-L-alanine amidase